MTDSPVDTKKLATAKLATACCLAVMVAATMAACAPVVRVAPPEEPITINLNVKIEHEIRVKVEEDLEQVFNEDSELF